MTVWKVQTMVMPAGAEIRDGVVGREPPEDGLDGVAGHCSVDWDFLCLLPSWRHPTAGAFGVGLYMVVN